MLKLTILICLIISLPVLSAETCSRTATINYQEVLVDTSSNNRGEGLRYYLEKDEVSKALLNEYQDNNRPTWKGAALSTVGSAMVLGGLLTTSDEAQGILGNRDFLLYGGIGFIAMSYIISKTNQFNNEYLLLKSIDEYNKRNTPKIYFAPVDSPKGIGASFGIGQEF